MKGIASFIAASFCAIGISNGRADSRGESAVYEGLEPGVFMSRWLVLGALPVSEKAEPSQEEQKAAFDKDLLADAGGEKDAQPVSGATATFDGQPYPWMFVGGKKESLDFIEIMGRKTNVIAYAYAEVVVKEATRVPLGVGSDDGVKIWLNGEVVHNNFVARALTPDDDYVSVTLKPGKNRLLFKVQNGIGDWGLACRRLDAAKLTDVFLRAVVNGDKQTLTQILEEGINVNAPNKQGVTPYHVAKIKGRFDIADFLVSRGADPNVPMPSKESLVDSLFSGVPQTGPGAAVLVAQDGKILYQKGFGLANIQHSVPITPETKFRIGSVTKQFTAAGILRLQEKGLLSVTDKLSKYMPDFPRADEVTIHHLLTHTSGIHSFTGKPDFLKNVTLYREPLEEIEVFKNDPYDFSPGEKWLYNNSGYFLLGYLIEKVSGKKYGEFLKEEFFDPLGMKNTGVHHWQPILTHEATGYAFDGEQTQNALNWDMSQAGGAGNLYSTVGDLFLWNEAVFSGKALNEESLKAAFTPVRLNDGNEANALGAQYGYGWMIREVRGMKIIEHGGGLPGFAAQLTRYTDANLTVAICSNPLPDSSGPSGKAADIAEIFLWQRMKPREAVPTEVAVDAKKYDDYVGRYEYIGGAILTVRRDGNRLFAQLSGQPEYEIFPRSENQFFWKVVVAQITFVRDDKGEVTHGVHEQNGAKFTAPKLKDEAAVEIDPALLDGYVGQYELMPGAIVTVTKDGANLYAQVTGQPKFQIYARSETEFVWKIVNASIAFKKNDEGKVVGATLSQAGQTLEAKRVQ